VLISLFKQRWVMAHHISQCKIAKHLCFSSSSIYVILSQDSGNPEKSQSILGKVDLCGMCNTIMLASENIGRLFFVLLSVTKV